MLPIGKKIRKARLRKDITQEQLAEEVGVSNAHISHIERGVRDIDTELLSKIARSLDCTPADLFKEDGEGKGDESSKEDNDKALLDYLHSIGVDSVDKCREILSPESIAKEVALLISQRLGKFKMNRKS